MRGHLIGGISTRSISSSLVDSGASQSMPNSSGVSWIEHTLIYNLQITIGTEQDGLCVLAIDNAFLMARGVASTHSLATELLVSQFT